MRQLITNTGTFGLAMALAGMTFNVPPAQAQVCYDCAGGTEGISCETGGISGNSCRITCEGGTCFCGTPGECGPEPELVQATQLTLDGSISLEKRGGKVSLVSNSSHARLSADRWSMVRAGAWVRTACHGRVIARRFSPMRVSILRAESRVLVL
jgi:hypothetical protein